MQKKLEEIIRKQYEIWRNGGNYTPDVIARTILSSPDLVVVEREKWDRLIEAVEEFQVKVESGKARSKDTYGKFKTALADLKEGK